MKSFSGYYCSYCEKKIYIDDGYVVLPTGFSQKIFCNDDCLTKWIDLVIEKHKPLQTLKV